MSGFKKVGGRVEVRWGGGRKSGICWRQTCGLGLSPQALVGGNPRDVNAVLPEYSEYRLENTEYRIQ